MAVLAGLREPAVHRLRTLWERVPQEERARLEELGSILTSSSGYVKLRRATRDAEYCVPYLGMYMAVVFFYPALLLLYCWVSELLIVPVDACELREVGDMCVVRGAVVVGM